MEKIENSIFNSLTLPENSEAYFKNKTLFFTKWNWDYSEFVAFQKECQKLIYRNKDHKVFIFCNHPHCFTLGRGNERGQDHLVDFDEAQTSLLKYPVYKIKRGGGITFHFTGQWIFYPIVSINEKNNLEDHMCWLLKSVKEVLRDDFGVANVMAAKKLMGVWVERSKMASIGVGVDRFITEHGIALNLITDEEMFSELKKINPCGIDPTTYISLDKFVSDKNLIENFHNSYIDKLD